MDIAVCGAQIPFAYGGAEQLMENLVAALRRAGHRAELVRLPSTWAREHVFDTAMAWRMVTIAADAVIATNFPSYFVQHDRKVVWLIHQHRAAYDLAGTDLSDFDDSDISLEDQRLLADWDTRVLEEALARFTISRVVTDRLARFNGLDSTPLYQPPPLHDRLHPGPFGPTVLAVNRLERNKRPHLLVEALAHSRSGARLAIAGTGSMRDELLRLARRLGVSDRLDLLGWVDDDELVERFATAGAVAYVPYDEEYGFVTLQAFRAGKPVITAHDSGGVLEWVVDGENGIVTDGSPRQLGAAFDRLVSDSALAERMGAAGAVKVADLAWEPVVDALVRPLTLAESRA